MRLLLVTLAFAASGCASILTGIRQDVLVDAQPPGATVVVVGGLPASVALTSEEVFGLKDTLVTLLGSNLPPPTRARLLALTPDALVTVLVTSLQLGQRLPADKAQAFGDTIELIPGPVRDRLSDYLGLETMGAAPRTVTLGKGRPWALVAFKEGHGARLLTIKTKFNWVTLLNILTLGLGAIVDVLTGAWRNLAVEELHFSLDPLPSPIPLPVPAPPVEPAAAPPGQL